MNRSLCLLAFPIGGKTTKSESDGKCLRCLGSITRTYRDVGVLGGDRVVVKAPTPPSARWASRALPGSSLCVVPISCRSSCPTWTPS